MMDDRYNIRESLRDGDGEFMTTRADRKRGWTQFRTKRADAGQNTCNMMVYDAVRVVKGH